MGFNCKKPKVVTRYILDPSYIDFDEFGVRHTAFMLKRDKNWGEISVFCIDGLYNSFLDNYSEKVYIEGDNLFKRRKEPLKTIARGDIKVQELLKIKTMTQDFIRLVYTDKRHYNITTEPNKNELFELYLAKKIAQISKLHLRKDWKRHYSKPKVVSITTKKKSG